MRGFCLALAARAPEGLLAARVGRAGEDEEQVREPVQIDQGERVDGSFARGPERDTLGAPADRARDVQARRYLAAAGKDEALQRLERFVRLVAIVLERVDLRLR